MIFNHLFEGKFMTRNLVFIAMAAALATQARASTMLAVGSGLPKLQGEYLTGRKAILPDDASSRVSLLLFGFTYQSRFEVEPWAKRFRGEFAKTPDVTFYEIPMIGGMARMGKWFIDSGMRRGTPQDDRENVITVYGGTDLWKARLGFQAEDAAYLVLLDPKGRIAWLHVGPLDEAAFQILAGKVRSLIPNR
jgi:hypothetical protein